MLPCLKNWSTFSETTCSLICPLTLADISFERIFLAFILTADKISVEKDNPYENKIITPNLSSVSPLLSAFSLKSQLFCQKLNPSKAILRNYFITNRIIAVEREYNMTSKTIMAPENRTFLMFSIFYIVAGIAQLASFAIEGSAPLHLPLLGIVSIVTGYLVFSMKKWAVPLVAGLLVVGIVFGATTLSSSMALQTFGGAMLLHVALIAYIILLLVASLYLLAQKEKLN